MSAGWFATTLKPLNLSANNDIGATVVTAGSDEIADYNKYLAEVMGGLDEINVIVQDEDIDVTGGDEVNAYSIFDDVVAKKSHVTIIAGAGELLDNASASTVGNDLKGLFDNTTHEYSDEFAEFITYDNSNSQVTGGAPDQLNDNPPDVIVPSIDKALDDTLSDYSDDEFDQYLSSV